MPTLYNQYIYRDGAWRQTGTSSDSVTYQLSLSEDTLTLTGSDGSTSSVSISGGGDESVFIAEYNTTFNADLLTAYNAGKTIFAVYNHVVYGLVDYTAGSGTVTNIFRFYAPDTGLSVKEVLCQLQNGTTTAWQNSTTSSPLGNITATGDITSTTTIESGDRLVINDESASKLNNSSITFGINSNQYLANDGTWQDMGDYVENYWTEDYSSYIYPESGEGFANLGYRNNTTEKTASIQYGASGGTHYDETYIGLSAEHIELNGDSVTVANSPTQNNEVANKLYVDTAVAGYTETDPVFSASAASGITSTDISNWNGKMSSSYIGCYMNNYLYIPKGWYYYNNASDFTYYFPFYVKNSSSKTISSSTYVREWGTTSSLFRLGTIQINGITQTGNVSLKNNVLYMFYHSDGLSYITEVANIHDIPDSTSDLTNDSNFVSDANYVHTDNNFTDTLEAKLNGVAEGATVDDKTWNGVGLNKSNGLGGTGYQVPILATTSATTAYLRKANFNPEANSIAQFDGSAMLNSTTPTAGDSSTKVATTAFVGSAISTAISGVNSFEYEVVQSLPTTNIKDHTIYLVAKTGSTGDVYDEYLYINNSWEHIGSTDVDLSGYVPTTRKVNNKALSSDITLTASDVGALPDSTVIPAQTAKIWTGRCITYESTAKVVTLDDPTGFSLTDKTMIAVTFEYYYGGGTAITLNVNNTGAKDVKTSSTTQINTFYGQDITPRWGNYDIVLFSYHEQFDSWVFCGSYVLQKTAYDLASNAVPKTRTVNGKALSSNITLTASDVSALPSSTVIPSASSTTPAMDGTAAVGTETTFARGDHVHPSDTSKVSKSGDTMTGALTFNREQNSDSKIVLRYDSDSATMIAPIGYNGDATNNTPIIEFMSTRANSSGSSNYNTILRRIATPSNNYDAANKLYVDTAISNINALPSQTGNSGKFLTTNGTTASWAEIDLSTKQDKYTITTATISASGWSNAVYSALQTTYPAASYDIDIELNGDLVTAEQKDAWSAAQIVGSATGNTIKALGDVPTIDIPVIVKATPTSDTYMADVESLLANI